MRKDPLESLDPGTEPGLRMRAWLGIAPLPSTRSWVPLSSARLIVIEALALVAATPNVATVAAAATNRERCGSILSPFGLRDSQGWGTEGPSFHGTLVVGPPLPDDGLARLDAGLVLLAGRRIGEAHVDAAVGAPAVADDRVGPARPDDDAVETQREAGGAHGDAAGVGDRVGEQRAAVRLDAVEAEVAGRHGHDGRRRRATAPAPA